MLFAKGICGVDGLGLMMEDRVWGGLAVGTESPKLGSQGIRCLGRDGNACHMQSYQCTHAGTRLAQGYNRSSRLFANKAGFTGTCACDKGGSE